MLYKKLHDIDNKGNRAGIYNNKIQFEYKKNVKDGNKKKEILDIAQENLHILKRLKQKTSHYNFYKYEKDYDKAQYYKRSHCAFPSIDFYKTQRANSFGGKYAYTPAYTPYNSLNNYYPKDIPKIFNANSHKKRFEDFHYEDFADIRPISKKENVENKKKKNEEKKSENEKKQENKENEENNIDKVGNNKKNKNNEENENKDDETKNEKNNNNENEKNKEENKIEENKKEENKIEENKKEENKKEENNNNEEKIKNDEGNRKESKDIEQSNDKSAEQIIKIDNENEPNSKKVENN